MALCFICVLLICCDTHRNRLIKKLPSYVKDGINLWDDNPFTDEKAALGRYLFYDRRLSINKTKACASCHAQEFSFTDNYKRSAGALGDLHQRNAKPLINLIYSNYLTAADSTLHFPEQQIQHPMFSQHPVELGIKGNEEKILRRISNDPYYRRQFKKIFSGENDAVTIKNIQYCITSFIKTIFSFNAPYDKYVYKEEKTALNKSQIRGMELFFSPALNCTSCHSGVNFNTPLLKDNKGDIQYYFNTGLYNMNGKGSYPSYDQGLIELTGEPADMGKYRVPTLRNLAFTAPYFHDGSVGTLDEVLAIYEQGGNLVLSGEKKGDGRMNPFKSPLLNGFKLNSQQRKDLISFLFSLSDSTVLKNPAYANPFTNDETKNNIP